MRSDDWSDATVLGITLHSPSTGFDRSRETSSPNELENLTLAMDWMKVMK